MIWNLEINDPNLKYLLEKERGQILKHKQLSMEFENAVNNIKDVETKQLIKDNQELFMDQVKVNKLKQELQLCQHIHKINFDFQDIVQLTSQINEFSGLIQGNHSQEIRGYIERKIQNIRLGLGQIENNIMEELKKYGFPNQEIKQQDLKKLTEIVNLIKSVRKIHPRFISQIMKECIYQAQFHFIEQEQPTSNINHSEWMFNYLNEQLEKYVNNLFHIDDNYKNIDNYVNPQLEINIQYLAQVLLEDYVFHTINQRLLRDQEEFIKNANYALSFLEAADQFELNLRNIFQNWEFNGIIERILLKMEELSILEGVLKWEKYLFNQNVFQEYQDKISQKNIQLFLSLVEEFQIVWNSLKGKYRDTPQLVEQHYKNIFQSFMELCLQYFSIVKELNEQDADYVRNLQQIQIQFLQTFYIGVEQIKQSFPEYKQEIKQLKQITIIKQIESLTTRVGDIIFKRLIVDMISLYDFYKSINNSTLFQNHQIYFLQHNSEQSKQINNYYYLANIGIQSIINDNILNRKYSIQLTTIIAKYINKRLYQLTLQSALKMQFTLDGIKIFMQIVLRTPLFLILQSTNVNTTKLIQKFELIGEALQNRNGQIQLPSEDLRIIRQLQY